MEQQTITMGEATYELRRVFQGPRPLFELMAERLAKGVEGNSPFDEGCGKAV